jgi:hypothetical protein
MSQSSIRLKAATGESWTAHAIRAAIGVTVAFQAVRLIPGGSRHQNLRIPSWLAVPTQCPAGCQAITSILCLCASAISVCGA